jgi:hypothetical protein
MYELIASSLMEIKWQFLWQKKHYMEENEDMFEKADYSK